MHKAKNVQQVTLHFFLNIISEILIHVYVNHPTTEKKNQQNPKPHNNNKMLKSNYVRN